MTAQPSPWKRLASDALPADCEVAVIGSGSGGSVVAARLAGHVDPGALVVLERGDEWLPGEFPTDFTGVRTGARSRRNPAGLFDFRVGRDRDSLTANGLGGGSLIYANVMLEPRPEVFSEGWPVDTDSKALAPYFDRVRATLDPEVHVDSDDVARGGPRVLARALSGTTYASRGASGEPTDFRGRPDADRPPLAKAGPLQRLATERGAVRTKVPVAINLTRPAGLNAAGIHQEKCTLCGNCMTGCNVGAKTTLWASYLPLAKRAGATIVTGTEVTTVLPSGVPGRRWRVSGTRWSRRGSRFTGAPFELLADVVVLGAGTLGTTGILLRSARAGLGLSHAVGEHFSGNGDTIGISYNSSTRLSGTGARNAHDPEVETGPTISATVDLRTPEGGHLVQDGAIPFGIAEAVKRLLGARFALQRDSKVWCDLRAGGCPPGCGALEHSQLWLAMGSESSAGRIEIDRAGRPRIVWSAAAESLYGRQLDDLKILADDADASLVTNPRHALAGRGLASSTPVTVHLLGGAVMSDHPGHGACDSSGRVYRHGGGVHDGLYVGDGALCPSSTGANPSLTIAALAERLAERLVGHDLQRLRAQA